jgi:hypothetical protein
VFVLLKWSTSQELYINIILLDLPANIRQGWKGLPGTNTSFLQKSVNYGQKKFYNIGPGHRYMYGKAIDVIIPVGKKIL